jgi:hypothetical protein
MADAEVRIDGMEPLLAKMKKLGKTAEAVHPAFNKSLALLKKDLQTYPPPKRYVRTFKLMRSWRFTSPPKGGKIGRVRSQGVSYNKYVQNLPTQSWFHRGYWNNTIQQVAQNRQVDVLRIFDKVLDEAVKE